MNLPIWQPRTSHRAWPGVVARYRHLLAIDPHVEPVTLLEGNTPLIPLPRVAAQIAPGLQLYAKYEGLNPTASFKDRGMTAAITQAKAEGATAVICASTGNTAASAAAYAARAGMTCVVLIPDGKVALGKLAGALAYGARVVAIRGSFDDGLRMVRETSAQAPIALVNSVNPARLQGQKTAAFELCEQLGRSPDWLALPVGNAGNITSYWLGFTECGNCACGRKPRLLGAQAAGSAPFIHGHPIAHPETMATAIRIGNPARFEEAKTALRESNGHILAVTDEEIFTAYRKLAREEGVFCEPSSATGLAGLMKRAQEVPEEFEGRTVVIVLTGHGLKDPDSAVLGLPEPEQIEPETSELLAMLKL